METETTKKADTSATPYTFAAWERGDARPAGFTIADAGRVGWTEKERYDFTLSETNTDMMYGFCMPHVARHLLDMLAPGMNKFVYGKFLATERVSVAVSQSGVNPTEIMAGDALAMAAGFSLASDGSMKPVRPLKVLVWSECVSAEEFAGRLEGHAIEWGINREAFNQLLLTRLFLMTPGAGPLKGKGDKRLRGHPITDLVCTLRDHGVKCDALIIDSASITAADLIALGGVAYQMDWAIMVVDRGGDPAAMRESSFVTRTARLLTRKEAKAANVPEESRDRCMLFTLS